MDTEGCVVRDLAVWIRRQAGVLIRDQLIRDQTWHVFFWPGIVVFAGPRGGGGQPEDKHSRIAVVFNSTGQ